MNGGAVHCYTGKNSAGGFGGISGQGISGSLPAADCKERRGDHWAFYGYFSSKEALFNSIVEPHAAALMGRFMEAQTTFAELPEKEQPEHMGLESGRCVDWMVDYICAHREPVKLLLCCAEGTSYEHFVHNMVEVEVEYTQRYMEVLRRLSRDIPVLDKSLCHIIASGMFNGIFEIVVHDMPRDQAMRDVDQLRAFYTAGWSKLMGE